MGKKLQNYLVATVCLLLSLFCITACGKTTHEVNFVVDGEVFFTLDTDGNEAVKMPETPVKDGYSFGGWYFDKDTYKKPFTEKMLLNTPLTEDIKVYCKWNTVDIPTGLSFKTLQIADDGVTVYGKVSNNTETFSFENEISVIEPSEFTVFFDNSGEEQAASKTISLNVGDNTVYIKETIDGNTVKTYTVTVRRRPFYTVTVDQANGEKTTTERVEEDRFITEPASPVKLGCTFKEWGYDFSRAITEDTPVTALYESNPEMGIFEFTSTADTCMITGLKQPVTEMVIPDYVTEIREYAFNNCKSLIKVTLGSNLKTINDSAFSGCKKLVEVINKSGLEIDHSPDNGYVGYYALNIATNGESKIVNKNGYLYFTYNNTNNLIGYAGNDTDLVLPEDFNGQSYKIYKYAFKDCKNLTRERSFSGNFLKNSKTIKYKQQVRKRVRVGVTSSDSYLSVCRLEFLIFFVFNTLFPRKYNLPLICHEKVLYRSKKKITV